MIYVHFANSSGEIFTPDVQPIPPQELGAVLRSDDGAIVIVDRHPSDAVSRVDVSVIISALLALLGESDKSSQASGTVAAAAVVVETEQQTDLFSQQTHRLDVDAVTVANLKSTAKAPTVQIFLPRMQYDMYGEAVAQREFYRNIPNIVIEPV